MKIEGGRVTFNLTDASKQLENSEKNQIIAAAPVDQSNARGSFSNTDLEEIHANAAKSANRLKTLSRK